MEAAEARRQRAFVAVSYLLGDRGEALAVSCLGPEARLLATALSHHDQARRVASLALEVARIAVALDEGTLR